MKSRMALLALGVVLSLFAQKKSPKTSVSPQEQERILDHVRKYALDYTKSLPDFICTQVTRRYMGDAKRGIWDRPEVITMRLSFFGQREEYKVISVNGRPSTLTMDQLGGTTSRGEFGTQLKMLFAPVSRARFAWKRWATLRNHRIHVYSYRIPRAHSQWHVKYEDRDSAAIGYRGLLYVDNDTEMVAKITAEAEDIPTTVPILQAWTELDYDFVTINAKEHLVPLRSATRLFTAKFQSRIEVEFREYRKFGSESRISFDTPEPLPKDKTEERAIK
jgi:hypothetical protein